MITNYELRERMRKVIRPNLQTLLLIALIVALPGLIANVIVARTGSDLTTYLFTHGIDTASTSEQILDAMTQFSVERGGVSLALSLLSLLITSVLELGFVNALLTLMRGGTATVGNVFSHLSYVLRAALLTLWTALKMFLWAMPGIALVVLALFAGVVSDFLGMVAASAGSILLAVLPIMAYYRYALANVFLADEPETGVLDCVRRSKAVMKGRKLQLFTLTLPFNFGRMLAIMLGVQLLGYVVGNLVSMVVQLVISVYVTGAICAFYEAYARPDGGRAHAFQTDPYHGEMQE